MPPARRWRSPACSKGSGADLRWGLVASAGTRLAAGTRVESGRCASIGLPDDSFLELTEINGLVAARRIEDAAQPLRAAARVAAAQPADRPGQRGRPDRQRQPADRGLPRAAQDRRGRQRLGLPGAAGGRRPDAGAQGDAHGRPRRRHRPAALPAGIRADRRHRAPERGALLPPGLFGGQRLHRDGVLPAGRPAQPHPPAAGSRHRAVLPASRSPPGWRPSTRPASSTATSSPTTS